MTDSSVTLSVIVPTHNRRERLRTLLESLSRQTEPPGNFEVVVVIDGSTDGTKEMLDEIDVPFRLVVEVQQQLRQAGATNRAVELAGGRYCLFLDDDMVASPEVVAAHLEAQTQGDNLVGIGKLSKLLPDRPARWARFRAFDRQRHYESIEAGEPPLFTDAYGGNLCMPKELFVGVGGLSSEVHAIDIDLGYRLFERGATFVYVPNAYAEEDDRESLSEFVADAQKRGADGLTLYERHPGLLPYILLGGRSEMDGLWGALLRLFIAVRVPPLWAAAAQPLIPGGYWAHSWYRTFFQYAYWHGVRGAVEDRDIWKRLRSGTIILTYHAVGGPDESGSRYLVTERRFRRQMRWLKARGYSVIPFEELTRCMRESELPPARSVVITFDDGYRDNVEIALPIMEELGFRATIFLVSQGGDQNLWDKDGELRERPLFTLEEARGLKDRIGFGAHTRTHASLIDLDSDAAQHEISGSKEELETALGSEVTIFSYPFGRVNAGVRRCVVGAGFQAACTVQMGENRAASDIFTLRRFDVRGTDWFLRFPATLWIRDRRFLLMRWRR